MKLTFRILFLLLVQFAIAQNDLKFDSRFVQSEDQWVAFAPDSTGSHPFGFIYIDAQAGLTLEYGGTFKIQNDGKFLTEKLERQSSMKYRLEPNSVLVAKIPEKHFAELNVEKVPDWLKHYKGNEGSIERLYRWGYMYNGWGECAKGIEFLEKGEQIDPNFKGLQVELAYSYNCLKQYQKAIDHLQKALKVSPNDSYSNKELIFAQTKIGQMKAAENVYRHVLRKGDNQSFNAENAYNILQAYYLNKDVDNFKRWISEAGATLSSDKRFKPLVDEMKSDLKL